MKVVIDTNIWVSFLIGNHLDGLLEIINREDVRIITCETLFLELETVLKRPKLEKYITEEDRSFIFEYLLRTTLQVETFGKIDVCRDRNDNFILEAAANGQADYIVTGDHDLLVLNLFQGIRIIPYSDFRSISVK